MKKLVRKIIYTLVSGIIAFLALGFFEGMSGSINSIEMLGFTVILMGLFIIARPTNWDDWTS